jgi:hypothetical protein
MSSKKYAILCIFIGMVYIWMEWHFTCKLPLRDQKPGYEIQILKKDE